jgi:hypothetical protein
MKSYLLIKKTSRLKKSIELEVIDDSLVSNIIFSLKERTTEEIPLMKVFNHISGGKILVNSPAIYLRQYHQGTVYSGSDFIQINNKVVWHKTQYPHFGKLLPLDYHLVKKNENILNVDKVKKIINITNGFSLCGVHANVWSHYLVQYLPKIDCIKKIIEITGEKLTIIIPPYHDQNIREILNALIFDINFINILELKIDEVAKCEKLYYVENTSVLSDHATYLSPTDCVIPKFVMSYLKNILLTNKLLFPSFVGQKIPQFRKLYIKRAVSSLSPLSNLRILENSAEIENFFESEGFEFIAPHEYSLDEKRKLFSEASIIAGSYSSGFMNMIFCQPDTKFLVFMNYQRIYELYLAKLSEAFKVNLLAVTGIDNQPESIHSSYTIPLKKVINSYQTLINENA